MRRAITGIIFDIDGTIARGRRVLPGVVETLPELRRRGIRFALFTNDNSSTVAAWVEKLARMGVEVSPDEVVTSALVAAEAAAELHPHSKILAIGDVGLLEALAAKGLDVIAKDDAALAEVVVMGNDPHFDQTLLATVCKAIWNGAEFLATNYDPRIPTANGFKPATGPMVKAVAYATSCEPLVTGKPSSWAARMALKVLGVSPEEGLIVGDQLATDIAMGNNAGIRTVLVLSGDATQADADEAPADNRPDAVLAGVDHLLEWLDASQLDADLDETVADRSRL